MVITIDNYGLQKQAYDKFDEDLEKLKEDLDRVRDEGPMEVSTDPKEIEEHYRQVSPEEMAWREGPASHDLESEEGKEDGGFSDWLENNEPGGQTPAALPEYQLNPEGPEGKGMEWKEWEEQDRAHKANLVSKLIKVANKLDEAGLYNEAEELDEIIKTLV